MFENLGITWQSMLFHIINLTVLVTALVFILYKPVKRMLSDERKKLSDIYDENKRLNEESAETKQKYEKVIEEVKDEAMRVSAETAEKAQKRAAELIEAAEKKAQEILDASKRESDLQRQRLAHEFEETVSAVAVEIASKVLGREISEKDNKDLIDTCLRDWDMS